MNDPARRHRRDAVAEPDPIWTEKFMAMGMHPVIDGVLERKVTESTEHN